MTDPITNHDSDSAETPQRIGRYTIVGLIGQGGQGAVYRALHPSLPIELAIKVSNCQIDAADQQTIRDEATILCELQHENIAHVRDLDVHDGHPFLVLDFVRGRSLGGLLKDGNVAVDQAAEWLQAVARAIDYAHRRGVLHLDLKPDNIVIDEHDSPKVIDFGLAKMRGAWRDRSDESDEVSGTLCYMSPEQARGVADEIHASSDIFALGAILYHVLVGHPPFQGEHFSEILAAAKECDIDRDALSGLDVPKRMIDACNKATAPLPCDRFASAAAFADALGTTRVKSSFSAQFLGCGVTLAVTMSAVLIAIAWPLSQYFDSGNSDHSIAMADPDNQDPQVLETDVVETKAPTWGLASASSTPGDVTPKQYLTALSDGADAWFKKPPSDKIALRKRLTEFSQGCERLLTMEHTVLAEDDRNWLTYKCRGWKKKLDQQLSQLDETSFAQANEAANKLAAEMTQQLKTRSMQS